MTFIPSWYAALLHNSTLCTEVNIYTSFYSRRGMEIDLLNKRTRETEFAFKQSNVYNYNSCSETHLLYFSEHICAQRKLKLCGGILRIHTAYKSNLPGCYHRSIMLSGEQNLIMTSNDAFIPAGGYHGYIMFSGEQNLITTSKDVYSMIIINHFYIMIFNHEYDHKLSVS